MIGRHHSFALTLSCGHKAASYNSHWCAYTIIGEMLSVPVNLQKSCIYTGAQSNTGKDLPD